MIPPPAAASFTPRHAVTSEIAARLATAFSIAITSALADCRQLHHAGGRDYAAAAIFEITGYRQLMPSLDYFFFIFD